MGQNRLGAASVAARTWRALIAGGALAAVLLLSAEAAAQGPATPSDGAFGDDLDSWVEAYADRHGLPGVSVAVVEDGALVATAAAGGGEEPLTDRSPLPIGSVSKMFTAFAVLQPVDGGRMGLDDPVRLHWPEFEVDDPRADRITVRHLLSHTSGLPSPMLVPPADDLEESAERLADMRLQADPGSSYAYSNPGYWAAARLVEVVSGEPFSDYLDRHLFAPAGMDATRNVEDWDEEELGRVGGHVTAYGAAMGLPEMTRFNTGSGGIVSTAHDMGLWLALQQRGGVAEDGTRLLSEELVAEAQTAQPRAGTYGLGWQHTSTADPARVGHDGSLTRYSSRVDLVPSNGYGVVVLLDSYTPTYQHPFAISTGVIELTEGGDPDPGAPVATIVDAVLGVLALGVLALQALGLRRAPRWALWRRARPAWRFGLRLVPQLLAFLAAVVVFLVLPAVEDNSATPLDAFALWPAAMILLLAAGAGGAVLTLARVWSRIRLRHEDPRGGSAAARESAGGSSGAAQGVPGL
jgi:CubicO group peptidase (beta-lactamase class C family)